MDVRTSFAVAALAAAIGAVLPLADAMLGPAAAQDSTDRSRPFSTDSVRLTVPGAWLGGVVHVPAGEGPHAAVLLLPGARDSRFLPWIAEDLAARGVVVLDLAKRGVGTSTGRWDRQSFRGRAEDAVVAVQYLQAHPAVDPARIGLIGHSQGGWIAQMVAADEPGVGFVVLLAGPGQTVRDQVLTYERLLHERRGRSPEEVDRAVASLRRQLGLASAIRPACTALRMHYICRIIDFDPAGYLARITVPVLAIFAEVDPMVPPELNIPLLCAGLRRAGNADVTVHVFPDANHDFFRARTGLPEEYHHLQRAHVPGFRELIGEWITAGTVPGRRRTTHGADCNQTGEP
jgi:uncharacterized protein